MNVQRTQELRRSNAATAIQGRRFDGPTADEWPSWDVATPTTGPCADWTCACCAEENQDGERWSFEGPDEPIAWLDDIDAAQNAYDNSIYSPKGI